MLLRSLYFVLLVPLIAAVDFSGMSMSAVNAVSRHVVTATLRHSPHHLPAMSSRAGGVARRRQFRRAFKRSLSQIFGMKTRPQRQATNGGGGGGRVPAYMRWLYEQSSSGRLPVVLNDLRRRRSASPKYRQKRHSQLTVNTVRSFTGRYARISSTNYVHKNFIMVYAKTQFRL